MSILQIIFILRIIKACVYITHTYTHFYTHTFFPCVHLRYLPVMPTRFFSFFFPSLQIYICFKLEHGIIFRVTLIKLVYEDYSSLYDARDVIDKCLTVCC